MITSLEAKLAALTHALEGLRAFRALETGTPPPGGGPGSGGPKGIRSDSFVNKTIPEATKMFLAMCNKTPQSIESVSQALQKGGVETKAANFSAMVQTILRRVENQTGEIFRIPSGEWALPEWYGKKPSPKRSGGDKAIDAIVSAEQTVEEATEELVNEKVS